MPLQSRFSTAYAHFTAAVNPLFMWSLFQSLGRWIGHSVADLRQRLAHNAKMSAVCEFDHNSTQPKTLSPT